MHHPIRCYDQCQYSKPGWLWTPPPPPKKKIVVYFIFSNHLHFPRIISYSSINYKKTPRLPWISKSLLRSINHKNRLYYIDKIKRTEQSHRKYISYKNTFTKTLRAEKIKYFKNKKSLFLNDIKNTWKIINCAINKRVDKHHITKITHNNMVYLMNPPK